MVGRIVSVFILVLAVTCSEQDWIRKHFITQIHATDSYLRQEILNPEPFQNHRRKPQESDQIDDAISRIIESEKSKELNEIDKFGEEQESELYESDLAEAETKEEKSSKQTACKGYKCQPGFRCKAMFSCAPKNEYCRQFGVWRGSCVQKKKKKGSKKEEDEIEQEEEEWDTDETEDEEETEEGSPTTDDPNGDTLTVDKKMEDLMSKKRENELCKDAVCGPGLRCAAKFSCAPVTSEFCKKRGKWTADCVVDENDPKRCTYAADPGNCRALMPSWYYNSAKKTCQKFDYGGCDGNGNRFQSEEECKAACQEK